MDTIVVRREQPKPPKELPIICVDGISPWNGDLQVRAEKSGQRDYPIRVQIMNGGTSCLFSLTEIREWANRLREFANEIEGK